MGTVSFILYVATIVIVAVGVIFSLVYIWLNVFSKVTDLLARNASVLKICKMSMILSLIFAMLSCILANDHALYEVVERATTLYSAIAISWVVSLLACAIGFFVVVLSKSAYKSESSKAIKKIFKIAVCGAIFGILLAWLFS